MNNIHATYRIRRSEVDEALKYLETWKTTGRWGNAELLDISEEVNRLINSRPSEKLFGYPLNFPISQIQYNKLSKGVETNEKVSMNHCNLCLCLISFYSLKTKL